MKKIVGIVLIALGVAMTATGVVGSTTEDVTPESVSIKEIEAGLRPEKDDEYWSVTKAHSVTDISSAGPKFAWVPFASSSKASWDDVRLIVRFNLKKWRIEEALDSVNPVGVVRTAQASGTLPPSILQKSPGIDQRVIVLYADEKPSSPLFLALSGIVIAFLGMFLVRNPRTSTPSRSPSEETDT